MIDRKNTKLHHRKMTEEATSYNQKQRGPQLESIQEIKKKNVIIIIAFGELAVDKTDDARTFRDELSK